VVRSYFKRLKSAIDIDGGDIHLLKKRCECIGPGCPSDMEDTSFVTRATEADQEH
jgi:hypothetical protein